jgi:hypothetical protein
MKVKSVVEKLLKDEFKLIGDNSIEYSFLHWHIIASFGCSGSEVNNVVDWGSKLIESLVLNEADLIFVSVSQNSCGNCRLARGWQGKRGHLNCLFKSCDILVNFSCSRCSASKSESASLQSVINCRRGTVLVLDFDKL